jgi:two-component system response regulator
MNNGKLILLVEDNPDDELLTLRAFKKSNILNEVIVARDGQQALDLLLPPANGGSAPVVPNVILLDLNLPKVGGLDVLKRLRAHEATRFLPVIVLTSSKQDEDVIRSYSLGANAYVRKPVDFAQFTQALEALGLFWLVVNEVPETS